MCARFSDISPIFHLFTIWQKYNAAQSRSTNRVSWSPTFDELAGYQMKNYIQMKNKYGLIYVCTYLDDVFILPFVYS